MSDGTEGAQRTMVMNTTEEVRTIACERVAPLGPAGSLILFPTRVFDQSVQPEDLPAFVEAARERQWRAAR